MDWDGLLWFGMGDDYRIYRIAYSGDTVAVVEGTRRRVPIPEQEADAALAELRDRLGAAAAIDPQWLPRERPAFEDIHVDRQGRLWVSVPVEGGGQSFDVFDLEGREVAVARFEEDAPRFEQVVIRGDFLYGVVRGELDVPYVVRYRISE